jgi:Protein of unknown function (DUF1168)
MSEPIAESIPTSADPRSKRPLKRRALTPVSEQAAQIDNLFKDPAKEIRLPATSKPRTAGLLPPPPEIVANVQGSSAGAGSGEFHVYKASRRREYERIRLMEEELKREKAHEDFERKMTDTKRKDEEKTEKNRRKREKKKTARNKKSCRNDGRGDEMIVDKSKIVEEEPLSALPEGSNGQSASNNLEETSCEAGVIIYED